MNVSSEKPGPASWSVTTLLVKRLPPNITASTAACHQFFTPFGSIDVRLMSSLSMRGSAFVDFPGNEAAAAARERLMTIDFNGKKLRVEYATPSRDRISSHISTGSSNGSITHIGAPPLSGKPIAPTKPPETSRFKSNTNTVQAGSAPSIAPALGVNYPFNPNLKYKYPDPTPEILTNMMQAIGSVPRLYNQVLHLMNKMNLPPPFGPVRKDAIPDTLKRKSDGLVASDESEMESSGEESDSRRNVKRMKAKDNHEQRQLALGRKKVTSTISINIPIVDTTKVTLAASALEPEEQHSAVVQEKYHVKTSESEGFKRTDLSKADQYISIETLDANKASPDDSQYSTAFKNYSEGEPTTRLYIKNLERKVVKESDLHNIFGRFVFDSKGDPDKDLDINLLLSGRMRGQAFVTFKDQETAKKALEGAHRYILHGKPMIIQFAKSQVAQRQ
ncbi:hypothetical protein BC943DRAFT_313010 [Umbelopsis sp. AD052]|nr:hypothetical protein BC943DRAFT_313010 [Umbelopsis sp. AD052]